MWCQEMDFESSGASLLAWGLNWRVARCQLQQLRPWRLTKSLRAQKHVQDAQEVNQNHETNAAALLARVSSWMRPTQGWRNSPVAVVLPVT